MVYSYRERHGSSRQVPLPSSIHTGIQFPYVNGGVRCSVCLLASYRGSSRLCTLDMTMKRCHVFLRVGKLVGQLDIHSCKDEKKTEVV